MARGHARYPAVSFLNNLAAKGGNSSMLKKKQMTAPPQEVKNPQVTFKPFFYEIRASSLYNEKDVLNALKEASSELIGYCKGENGSYLVKESLRVSNMMILFGWIAIGLGLYCFRLPFNSTNKMMIATTAAVYWIVASTFFILDFTYLDQLISAFKFRRVSGKTAAGKNALYVRYDPDKAIVRWVITNRFSVGSHVIAGFGRIFRWKNIPYLRSVLYLFQRVRPLARRDPKSTFLNQEELWLPYNEALSDQNVYKAVCHILETGRTDDYDSGSNKKSDDTHKVGTILERDVTWYFDENGFVVQDHLQADLKTLFFSL